jgi:hypothetical protein
MIFFSLIAERGTILVEWVTPTPPPTPTPTPTPTTPTSTTITATDLSKVVSVTRMIHDRLICSAQTNLIRTYTFETLAFHIVSKLFKKNFMKLILISQIQIQKKKKKKK